jgi:outer membrane autotransporter protein
VRRARLFALLASTALTALLPPAGLAADEVIDGGAVETINTPWNIDGTLIVGDTSTGTLTVSPGGTVTSTSSTTVGNTVSGMGVVNVEGSGSSLTANGNLNVGDDGQGTLTISDGGTVSTLLLGYVGGASGVGMVEVTGENSSFSTGALLYVGFYGDGTLEISAGGAASSAADIRIGHDAGAIGIVGVDGPGSSLTVDEDLYVADFGTATLTVSNGSTLSSDVGYIGHEAGSHGTVSVTGAGSSWANSRALAVGYGGFGTLTISDGGVVSNTTGSIGFAPGSEGTVTVTGPDSAWINSGDVFVGRGGTGTLTISAGGAVSGEYGFIGSAVGSTGTVAVTGAGSNWALTRDLEVGDFGTGTLTISDQGTVTSRGTEIGYEANAVGTVTVTGLGSNLTSTEDIYVGVSGTGTLNALAGGSVDGGDMYVGLWLDSTGTVEVAGAQSSITADRFVYVGYEGSGTLEISQGGTLSHADNGWVGYAAQAVGSASVSGAGSQWSMGDDLYIAELGTGTLTISDGGSVSNDNGYVGHGAGSDGTVDVTGEDSNWTNHADLFVGYEGSGKLTIADGGTVSSTLGYIGHETGSEGTVVVTGAGSNWSVHGLLAVGFGGAGTLTISDHGEVDSFSGVVGFDPTGSGTVEVTGNGSSWSNDGALLVGYRSAGTIAISAGGSVSSASAQIGLYEAGIVNVAGPGSKWTNSGDLAIGFVGEGTFTISDGGTVTAAAATLASLGSATGTLNIGAAAGDAAAAAGTLDSPTLEFGSGEGTLVFNHTGTGHQFDTDISGSGTIRHLAGTTALTGDSVGFSGVTELEGGTLLVNGALGGALNVTGGTLGGSGSAATVTVAAGGSLAPGNSTGTLGVASATLDAGSLYEVELNDGGFVPGTNNDLLQASGTVTINGGTVHVTAENTTDSGSTYTPGTYTIITAAGGVTGTFDALTDDFAFLDFALDYGTLNQVDLISNLSGGGSGTCPPGLSFNQLASCGGVLSAGSGSLYTAVINLSNAEAPVALDLVSGEIHASLPAVLVDDSRFAREAAIDRLRTALGGGDAGTTPGTNLWAEGYGNWSRRNGDGNAATVDHSTGGFLVGADAEVMGDAYFGLMAGYGRSAVTIADRTSSATIDGYTLGAYGGAAWDGLSVKGGAAWSWHDLGTTRSIDFTGFSDSLSASYQARTLQAYAEASYAFDVGQARLEPFAGLAHVHLDTDGFAENGGAAALIGEAADQRGTFATLGLRSEAEVELGSVDAVLSGGIGWRHAFGATPSATHRLASGGDSFSIAGAPLVEDTIVLDAGIELTLADNAKLGASYSGQFAQGLSDHSARASLTVGF